MTMTVMMMMMMIIIIIRLVVRPSLLYTSRRTNAYLMRLNIAERSDSTPREYSR